MAAAATSVSPGRRKAEAPHHGAAFGAVDEGGEAAGRGRACALGADHERLVDGLVERGGHRQGPAARGHRGQGQGHEGHVGVAGAGVFERLLYVLTEHEARLDRVPNARVPERLFGGAAIGCMLGVGDRDLGEAGVPEVAEAARRRHRGLVRPPEDDPAACVELLGRAVAAAGAGHVLDEGHVGRREHVEGRALLDLAGEEAGRTQGEDHRNAGALFEARSEIAKGKGQVRGGRHLERHPSGGVLVRRRAAGPEQERGEEHRGEPGRASMDQPGFATSTETSATS